MLLLVVAMFLLACLSLVLLLNHALVEIRLCLLVGGLGCLLGDSLALGIGGIGSLGQNLGSLLLLVCMCSIFQIWFLAICILLGFL